jgi:adenylate cyclase
VSADQVERKLAAIFAADVEGYSRLMGIDEVGTLRTLTAYREIIDALIARDRGRIFNTAGDSVLAEFPSVVDAVQCAVDVQRAMAEENTKRLPKQQMRFRIGVHVGDVLVKGDNLFGDGVNIAARLETLAEPGGICVSGSVRDYVGKKLPVVFTDCGEQAVKNIAEPVRAYRIGASATVPIGTDERAPLPLPDKPSIAILPFTNMSGDPEQEYFADGIVEEIITALSRVPSLFVIARNSSFTYKGKAIDIKQVGRELGVRYVLEGSVRKAGSRVRITGQLIQADTGGHIWAERYDGDLADIFELQDQITASVAGAIVPSLEKAEIVRAQRKQPENLDAYDLYLRALPGLYAYSRDGNDQAVELLRRAVALDPGFAPALRLLADCLASRLFQVWSSGSEVGAEAIHYARMAAALDKDDPEALSELATDIAIFEGKHAEALSLVERAVGLNPNSAMCWRHSGWVHAYQGQSETALNHFQRALRLSPRDPRDFAPWTGMALAFIQLGRDQEAISAARNAVQRAPTHLPSWRMLTAALALAGNTEEARAAMTHHQTLAPEFTVSGSRSRMTLTHQASSRLDEGLRKAGMPE